MKRLLTALFSATLIATFFAGTPAPTFAAVDGDEWYIATVEDPYDNGLSGMCATPDYTVDWDDPWDNDPYWNSLTEGIQYLLINKVESGDTIVICNGWYTTEISYGVFDGGTYGDTVEPMDLTIRGANGANNMISGTNWWNNAFNETFIRTTNVNLTLENLNFDRAGQTSSVNVDSAVYVDSGSLTIDNVNFYNSMNDGAVVVEDSDLTVTNSLFSIDEYYLYTRGAAINSYVDDRSSTSIEISNTEFRGNGAGGDGYDGYGGAIATWCADMTITDSFFKDNSSGLNGGSIYAGSESSCPNNTLTIDNTKFRSTSGDATANSGGAILSEGQNLTISNSKFGSWNHGFEAYKGGAIAINDHTTGNAVVSISNTSFSGNEAYDNGGALWARCADVTITGDGDGGMWNTDHRFNDNYAGTNGGAVYSGGDNCDEDPTLTITGMGFDYNRADRGGAIASAQHTSDLALIDVSDSFFYNSFADLNGGAINSDYVDVTIDNSSFLRNWSYGQSDNYRDTCGYDCGFDALGGGVAEIMQADLTITDSNISGSLAFNGHGGAIIMRNDGEMNISGTTFFGNRARHDGGAIYREENTWVSGNRDTITDSVFEDNSTGLNGDGGAIFTDTTTGITSTRFTNNTAGFYQLDGSYQGDEYNNDAAGGAVSAGSHHGPASDDGAVNAGLSLVDVTFTNNRAAQVGGAVYNNGPELSIAGSSFTYNSVAVDYGDDGGAVWGYLWGCQPECVTVTGSTFSHNFANYEGGAIYLAEGNIVVRSSSFTDNVAANDNGGAISVDDPFAYEGRVGLIQDSLFQRNYAESEGGAISFEDAKMVVNNSRFYDNIGDYGGAINLDSADVPGADMSIINSDFGRNSAAYGGAVYSDNQGFAIRNSRFTSNTADDEGGAVYAVPNYDQKVVMESNLFRSNSAGSRGGAVTLYGVKGDTVFSRNLVDGNRSVSGAGLYIWSEEDNASAMAIHTNEFSANVASGEGGGISITLNPFGDAAQIPANLRGNKFSLNRAYYGAAGVVYYNIGQIKVVAKSLAAFTKTTKYQKNKSTVRAADKLMLKYTYPTP